MPAAAGDSEPAISVCIAQRALCAAAGGGDDARTYFLTLICETDDVEAVYRRAVEKGATEVAAPVEKPWGQVVGWVRAPEGTLVAIGSPVE